MKKKIALILVLALAVALVGCGSTSTPESTETATEVSVENEIETATPEPTEAPHEHAYTETITTEATCTTDGEKSFTCECGDTYTEVITATGHIFENYVSNEDATYTADGTETATCVCGETDTRTAEGSMLTYTYTDMDATMYAQKTVNLRSMPSTDGEKLGSLSTNDEVKVTGQCVETSWYRIEFDGNVAYVSNDYLGNDKVVVQEEAPAQSTSSDFPYELYKMYDNGSVAWFYFPANHGYPPEYHAAYQAVMNYNYSRYPYDGGKPAAFTEACAAAGSPTGDVYVTSWKVNGQTVTQYFAW